MKKIISAALLLVVCIFLMPAASAAQADVVVTLSGGSASAGESIKVDLSLTASVPVNSIAVSGFTYDTDVLAFTGFSDYEHLDGLTALPPTFDEEKGAVIIGLQQAQAFDGKLCSLNFEVSEDAAAGTVSVNADALVKNGATTVSSAVTPAVITVSGSTPTAYTITVGEVENGIVSVDKGTAAIGETVTVTAVPANGYVLKSVCVDGAAIEGNTFTVTGDHVVTAVFEKKTQEQSTLGYFSLDVIKTIIVNGEAVDICRWVWTPFAD